MAEFGCLYSEVLLTRNAWEKRKLGELAEFINGRAYKQDELLASGKYPVLRVGNFYTNDNWYYSDLELPEKYYAEKGDLLYTWSATFGPHIWIGPKVIYHYHIWKVALKNLFEKDFALQFFEADRVRLLNSTNGSTMIHVTKKDMESKGILLPDISEQRNIGEFLRKADDLIAATQHKIDALEQIKEKLSQNLFDQSWRFKEYSTPWKENKLKDIVSAYSGGTPSANIRTYYGGHIPFIRSAEIHSSTTALTLTQEGLQNSSAKLVKTGDILYALYGANSGDVDRSKINGAINQAILAMRPSKENDPNFILFQLMRMKDKIVSTYLQGGQGNLSGRLILALNLDMPESTLEQRTIGRLLQLLCELIGVNQSKYSQLELLKKSLLQNLFV
ncbi:restriction endonuclease subunit S [Lacticaseibacillus paracasei]|uniref:Type I restriction enzyme specificity protein n=1 Tax=Lacticaseibacillus paracasei subsp. paracasei Lpp41 TaxID=1256208 RepID=A0A829H680_LACPA|nr:restriction endonuclease subunit S [Lacticaseibacillus paracasei]EPC71961.1 type I restriction enzyme specificity protein [Lacticaseibacillus paracasei subsp. paracasei Lpp41]MCT3345234.1 restriction endonuclease subunit S [Lacticaseibacillus paracasei]RND77275.1 EcoKI restriction-modification system protein HsdS [Lacticaseibacillus paracasei]RND83832.1 EcoKI restriction-modification system protein HsdS [Lacticaseibacillus paracasei]RNE30370.1 EcoKI restriction-modification system protein H